MFPIPNSSRAIMDHLESSGPAGLTKVGAIIACTSMAVFYVAILYSPTLILRLPHPGTFKSLMIRRFVCAGVSSIISIILSAFILHIQELNTSYIFAIYGIRMDHFWQALVFPLSLTSLMYAGSFALKILPMLQPHKEHNGINISIFDIKSIVEWVVSNTSNVSLWRNYFVAPFTEELVFRACMIPLLLSGGFTVKNVIFLCPIFFSLALLNHLLEGKYSWLKACTIVGFQLGYTVIFGAYASFLLVRTGHIIAPLIAHMFCNFMGLPVIISRKYGIVSVAFLLGLLGFLRLVFPLTSPHLYCDGRENCNCWDLYCVWN